MSAAIFAQDRELQATIPLVEECLRHAVRRMRTRMLTRSGTDTPVRVIQTRLCTVSELNEQPEMQNAGAWCGFYVDRGTASGFAALEGALTERLTARLFGDPTVLSQEVAGRAATEVELRVATRLSEELFLALEAHWPARPAPRMVPRAATPNRHSVADTTTTAAVMACTLEFGTEEEPLGRLILALPAAMLRGVLGVVETPANVRAARERGTNYERVMACEVELVVELTRLTSSLGALQSLRIGDELPLGSLNEVRALVNGRPSFAGEPGVCDGVRSFRVSRRVLAIATNV